MKLFLAILSLLCVLLCCFMATDASAAYPCQRGVVVTVPATAGIMEIAAGNRVGWWWSKPTPPVVVPVVPPVVVPVPNACTPAACTPDACAPAVTVDAAAAGRRHPVARVVVAVGKLAVHVVPHPIARLRDRRQPD